MSVEPFPEGTIVANRHEIRIDLGAVPGGRLYLALSEADGRPAKRWLLALPAAGAADLRPAGQPTDGGAVPGVVERLELAGQTVLVLDTPPGGAPLATLLPATDDGAAAALLLALADLAAELLGRGASAANCAAESLVRRPDGAISYLGPVVADPAPAADLSALIDLALADQPWSDELLAVADAGRRPLDAAGLTAWQEQLAMLAAEPPALVTVAWATDTGPVRRENEDSAAWVRQVLACGSGEAELDILAVADGMGGHRAGAEASRLALTAFTGGFMMALAVAAVDGHGPDTLSNAQLVAALEEAIQAADEAVGTLGNESEQRPPGSTLVVGVRLGRRLAVGNVGDSRAYLLRAGELMRLTRDDSVVQDLVDRGELTAEETYGHPVSNAVTQCLGRGLAAVPSCSLRLLRAGDRVLLGSDGITEQLRDNEVAAVLGHYADTTLAAQAMVAMAAEAGGTDNTTAVVMTLQGE